VTLIGPLKLGDYRLKLCMWVQRF